MLRDSGVCGSVVDEDAPPGRPETAILHVDMDAFFAAVEVLDDRRLLGKPVIVGGSGPRGVVASCTYEARRFGVRSAMPSVRARRLCPDAVFVEGHYSRYAEVSSELHRILHGVTPVVEPIGLDEAFLDVTGSIRLMGDPVGIAGRLRRRVEEELSLGCSIGAGRSKLIAKLASKAAKPVGSRHGVEPGPGVVAVLEAEEGAFLQPLPVEALWGVGPSTAACLHDLGIGTVGQLRTVPVEILVRRLGRVHGERLASLARGIDPDPVVPDRPAKSVGHEETFARDIVDPVDLHRQVTRMSESVAVHLRRVGMAGRTVTVKLKHADFSIVSRSHTARSAMATGSEIGEVARELLGALEVGSGVRLLGVSVSALERGDVGRQLAFDLEGTGPARRVEVTTAVDAVRARFGRTAVGTAAMVGEDGVEVPGRRESPWGPPAPGS